MKIASTAIVPNLKVLRDLPESKPEEPAVVTTDATAPAEWTYAVAAVPRNRPYAAFTDAMNNPLVGALELGTKALASALPGKIGYAVKGVWWVVNGADTALKLWDTISMPPTERALRKNENTVPIAVLDLSAHILAGASMLSEPTASETAITADGGSTEWVDTLDGLSLLIRASQAEVKGESSTDVFVQAHLTKSVPGYELAKKLMSIPGAFVQASDTPGSIALESLVVSGDPESEQ